MCYDDLKAYPSLSNWLKLFSLREKSNWQCQFWDQFNLKWNFSSSSDICFSCTLMQSKYMNIIVESWLIPLNHQISRMTTACCFYSSILLLSTDRYLLNPMTNEGMVRLHYRNSHSVHHLHNQRCRRLL